VNRDTQSVLLVLLGGAVVRISVDDTYLRYVRSWTRPYLLTAGLLLVVLGLVSLWREHLARRSRGAGSESGTAVGAHDQAFGAGQPAAGYPTQPAATDLAGSDGPEHDHGHGPRVAWLLLLPIFAIFLVAPPALGSYAAGRGGNDIAQPQGDSSFAPLPDGDPVTTTLADYATRAIWDQGRSLQARRIRLLGFVSPRPGGGYYVTRLVITCCAADARPIKIAVQGQAGQFAPDSWIAVTGSYGGMDAAAAKREQIPIIKADAVTQVKAPSEPYES
jgi:uncharacterized repeat protein (TIGR03943 family)